MRVWLALAGLLLIGGAAAVEQIESFHSDIQIMADGAMEVTETIAVRAEGSLIRRGIYRDFPTDYRDRYGNRVNVKFSLMGATRDGEVEGTRVERLSNGLRVYLGRADYFLPTGSYRYAITYRTNFQLGYFEQFDELYWNVTGLGWDLPILQASATVRLPEPVDPDRLQLAAYTGPRGSRAGDYEVSTQTPGVIRFDATRRLGPREGLTIAVGFPKGLVPEPSVADRGARFFSDNLGLLVGFLGLIGVLWFYISRWRKYGKDPARGIIIPRYEPPQGYSPASLRYIWRMKYDPTCMAAALVNLAVKGKVRLKQDKGWFSKKFSVERTDSEEPQEFSPGELAVYSKLVGSRRKLEFDKDNHSRIAGALAAQEAALKRDYNRNYFVRNAGTLWGGIAMSAGVFLLMLVLNAGMPALGGVVLVLLVIINVLFGLWMKAPTMRGRKLMDQIEGLRLYLGVAERQDLERRHEPPHTFEQFEKMLPYAVALDCANTWVDRFERVLYQLESSGQLDNRGWYIGDGDISARGITKSVNSISSSLSSAISSSSSPPGSSSGSGGGGFSGGGGGGGGGGGW